MVKAIAILDKKREAMKQHASCEVHFNTSADAACNVADHANREGASDGK